MFKIFWNHSKSNFKNNMMTKVTSFIPMFIWINAGGFEGNEKGRPLILALGVGLIIAIALMIIFFDLSVPKTLFICPVSYEDRKKYIKKVLKLKILVCVASWLITSVILSVCTDYSREIGFYNIVMQGILLAMVLWIDSMDYILPGMGMDAKTDNYTRMARVIGWRDSTFKLLFELVALIIIVSLWHMEPGFDFLTIFQLTVVIAGALLIRRFYREHFNLFLSMAADYETYLRYEKPIKK